MKLKKLKFNLIGGPGSRELRFVEEPGITRVRLKPEKSTLVVHVPSGLPANTKPNTHITTPTRSSWASRQRAARSMQETRPPPLAATSNHKPPTAYAAEPIAPVATASFAPPINGPAAALAAALSQGRSNHVHPVGDEPRAAPIQNGVSRGAPPPIKQKPKVKPRGPMVSTCPNQCCLHTCRYLQVRALYAYDAQDTDELSFSEGQVDKVMFNF